MSEWDDERLRVLLRVLPPAPEHLVATTRDIPAVVEQDPLHHEFDRDQPEQVDPAAEDWSDTLDHDGEVENPESGGTGWAVGEDDLT